MLSERSEIAWAASLSPAMLPLGCTRLAILNTVVSVEFAPDWIVNNVTFLIFCFSCCHSFFLELPD